MSAKIMWKKCYDSIKTVAKTVPSAEDSMKGVKNAASKMRAGVDEIVEKRKLYAESETAKLKKSLKDLSKENSDLKMQNLNLSAENSDLKSRGWLSIFKSPKTEPESRKSSKKWALAKKMPQIFTIFATATYLAKTVRKVVFITPFIAIAAIYTKFKKFF